MLKMSKFLAPTLRMVLTVVAVLHSVAWNPCGIEKIESHNALRSVFSPNVLAEALFVRLFC